MIQQTQLTVNGISVYTDIISNEEAEEFAQNG